MMLNVYGYNGYKWTEGCREKRERVKAGAEEKSRGG